MNIELSPPPPAPTHLQEEEKQAFIIRLYVAHFLSRWGARMWEFSVGLYMIKLWPNSLLFAAIYGVVESSSTALFGPTVGQLLDNYTYVKVLRLWLITQNLSFILAGGSVIALLTFSDWRFTNFTLFISLVILTNVSGALGVLSTLAGTILVEREWVVVISEGHPPEKLTKMNSVIRRIDLSCKLLAPVATGFIISFVSLKASATTLALWTTLTVWVEYWLFTSVYQGIPALQRSSQRRLARLQTKSDLEEENTSTLHEQKSLISNDQGCKPSPRNKIINWVSKAPIVSAWKAYIMQDVALAGVSLALLFFTVLSFGTLMTATLEWQGIPTYAIGIARGLNAVVGIAATVVYPFLQSRITSIRTGLWSIWSQWICLLVCVGSIWMQNKSLSAYMLMAGVILSRLGLWMFDLAVIQEMQDRVSESDRCVVGAVQNSLQSIMDLLTYVMGIIISNPMDFWKLNLMSFFAVTLAAMIYTYHLFRVRKHLIHYEKLAVVVQSYMRAS
ncbi:hypothetical protein ACFE04_000715 [Oxalis oulophora]